MASSAESDWRAKSLDDIMQVLKQSMPEITNRYKVKSLGIFGSYVRGDVKRSSDLDILVEFHQAPSLLEFIRRGTTLAASRHKSRSGHEKVPEATYRSPNSSRSGSCMKATDDEDN